MPEAAASSLKELDEQLANSAFILRDTPAELLTKEPLNSLRLHTLHWYQKIEDEARAKSKTGRIPSATSNLLELLDACAEEAGVLAAVVDRRVREPEGAGRLESYQMDLQIIGKASLEIRKKIAAVRRAVGDIMAVEGRRKPPSGKIF